MYSMYYSQMLMDIYSITLHGHGYYWVDAKHNGDKEQVLVTVCFTY